VLTIPVTVLLVYTHCVITGFTAFVACMCSILFGLALTLVLLSVYKVALPALPISIALGVTAYFMTRFSLQPYLEALTEHQLYV
jgi:presenilin 1